MAKTQSRFDTLSLKKPSYGLVVIKTDMRRYGASVTNLKPAYKYPRITETGRPKLCKSPVNRLNLPALTISLLPITWELHLIPKNILIH